VQILDSISCGNDYTQAATMADVYDSNGGYFTVAGNDVFAQLEYGGLGQTFWTPEFHVPVGNGILQPSTTGIRFRNYLAGQTGIVSGALSESAEPAVALTAGGNANPVSNVITGIVDATGAPISGTGFTVVHVGTGLYTINFTSPFANAPAVIATAFPATAANRVVAITATAVSSAGLALYQSNTNTLTDTGFMFQAQAP
jgi:hypothetical protein